MDLRWRRVACCLAAPKAAEASLVVVGHAVRFLTSPALAWHVSTVPLGMPTMQLTPPESLERNRSVTVDSAIGSSLALKASRVMRDTTHNVAGTIGRGGGGRPYELVDHTYSCVMGTIEQRSTSRERTSTLRDGSGSWNPTPRGTAPRTVWSVERQALLSSGVGPARHTGSPELVTHFAS